VTTGNVVVLAPRLCSLRNCCGGLNADLAGTLKAEESVICIRGLEHSVGEECEAVAARPVRIVAEVETDLGLCGDGEQEQCDEFHAVLWTVTTVMSSFWPPCLGSLRDCGGVLNADFAGTREAEEFVCCVRGFEDSVGNEGEAVARRGCFGILRRWRCGPRLNATSARRSR
jgi:hypothetical protein